MGGCVAPFSVVLFFLSFVEILGVYGIGWDKKKDSENVKA